jgi:hypothetical protein
MGECNAHPFKRKIMTGKKYFYALGQSVRAKGMTKDQGMALYAIESAQDYARIAFDAGYRGLSI